VTLLSSPFGIMGRIASVCPDVADPRVFVVMSERGPIGFSGTGIFCEEALMKLAGEAIERTAWASYLPENVVLDSHSSLKHHGCNVPDRRLLEVYSEDMLSRHDNILAEFDPEKVIAWIKCRSLLSRQDVLIPAQIMTPLYQKLEPKTRKRFWHSVSTGTAAHVDFRKALLKSIIECYEADAFMLTWYTLRSPPLIDYTDSVIEDMLDVLIGTHSRSNVPTVNSLYLSLPHTSAHVILTLIVNEKSGYPFFSLGLGSDLNPVRATYHSILEAAAVYISSRAHLGTKLADYLSIRDHERLYDLRSNYLFYQKPENRGLSRHIVNSLVAGNRSIKLESLQDNDLGNDSRNLVSLLRKLRRTSRYASFYDITTEHARRLGFCVTKV